MVTMSRGCGDTFAQLRRLAESFAGPRSGAFEKRLRRAARVVGAPAIPTCLRELAGEDAERRQWACDLLREVEELHHERIVRGLHELLASDAPDDAKVDAISLLAELGETSAPVQFADPAALQRRSASRLAEHLESPAQIAATADAMVSQLTPDDLLEMVESMIDAAPARAGRLVDELVARVELDSAVRSELRRLAAPLAMTSDHAPRPPDPSPAAPPTFLEILRDDRGRTVVVIGGTGAAADAAGPHTPRTAGAGDRRRRIWCVLIDESGTLIDAMYDEGRGPERLLAEVVTPLLSDGYGHLHEPLSEVRRRVAEAARKGASSGRLPAAYYLGRDLLDLGDIHVAERAAPDLRATLLGRAVDLLALGQAARARPLLERCAGEAPDDAVAASSLGLCLLAIGDVTAARTWLERAAALEPGWPIHHWNAAAAAHRAGRTGACYLALRRFLDVAAAVRRDGELDARADVARRFVADYERMCRLEGHDPARRAAAEARRPVLRSRTHRTSGASRPAHPAETPR